MTGLILIAAVSFSAGWILWRMSASINASRRETLRYLQMIDDHETRIMQAHGRRFTHPN